MNEPRWVLVPGLNRCTRCGELVEQAWCWIVGNVRKHATCEACAEAETKS